jgi:hypothetical protein
MQENEWVRSILGEIHSRLVSSDDHLQVIAGSRLLYAYEVRYYQDNNRPESVFMDYETDMLVTESANNRWKPRVVIETKLKQVTTHDAITYSQKATTHKQVHPYLRYGMLLGNRGNYPLPGRLFRHGSHFDFMVSWAAERPTTEELNYFIQLLLEEVAASRLMEEVIYESRSPHRNRYTLLHKKLVVR